MPRVLSSGRWISTGAGGLAFLGECDGTRHAYSRSHAWANANNAFAVAVPYAIEMPLSAQLNVFDISTPTSPSRIATTNTTTGGTMGDCILLGNRVYTLVGSQGYGQNSQLDAWDISTPGTPSNVGGYVFSSYTTTSAFLYGFSRAGHDYMIAMMLLTGVETQYYPYVWDVTTPSAPTVAAELSVSTTGPDPVGFVDPYYLVTDRGADYLYIYDLSNLASIPAPTSLTYGNTATDWLNAGMVETGFTFTDYEDGSTGNSKILTWDMSGTPSVVGSINTDSVWSGLGNNNNGFDLWIVGTHLYYVDYQNYGGASAAIQSLDITTPSALSYSGRLVVDEAGTFTPYGLTPQGQRLMLWGEMGNSRLQIFSTY